MNEREAVQLATISLHKFCGGRTDCASSRVRHTQKIKDRWLIEFNTAANEYGVAVQPDGNTDISIWNKTPDASR